MNVWPRPAALSITLLVSLVVVSPAAASAQTVYHGCPMQGDAKSQQVQALDRLKNRDVAPTPSQIVSSITLKAILEPGDDVDRWKDSEGATIEGYVAGVKVGGVETVNCHARDPAYRDTHIELVLDPMSAAQNERMVVEVTPRWRAKMAAGGIDWSTRALRDHLLGRWVRVTGWMFFDAEHKGESENTAPGRPRNWRATAWEIHPVTAIDVLQGKPP